MRAAAGTCAASSRIFLLCHDVPAESLLLAASGAVSSSGGSLTGCEQAGVRYEDTGHMSTMRNKRRAGHLGRQQMRGECALLLISDQVSYFYTYYTDPLATLESINKEYTLYHVAYNCMRILSQL